MSAKNHASGEHAEPEGPSPAPSLLMLLTVVSVAGAAGIAAIVPTATWVRFFEHPLVAHATTRAGAELFRFMLSIAAMVLLLGTLAIIRLQGRSIRVAEAELSGTHRGTLYGVLALVLIGLLIRATRINESLWYDEVASWQTYNGGTKSFGAVLGAFLDPINHTFHTLLNRFSVHWLVGEIGLELAFRLPALLFSLATIPIMYGLGALICSRATGWIAAALAAIAPVCVLEGVEARGYAQMMFFGAAATLLLLQAWRRGSPTLWLMYSLCCALGVWSQFVTAWLAIGHGVWILWQMFRSYEQRARCAQGLVALTIAGVFAFTLHAPMIPGLLAWRDNFVAARPDQPRILGAEGLHALLQLGGSWAWWAAVLGLGFMLIGGVVAIDRRNDRSLQRDALTLSLLGLPLMIGLVAFSGTWLYARFLLFAVPGALLTIAIGIHWVLAHRKGIGFASVVILLFAFAADLSFRPPKQPLREAVEVVTSRANDSDRVVAIGLAHDVLSIYGLELNIVHSFMFGIDLRDKLAVHQPRFVIVLYPLHVPRDRYEILQEFGYRQAAPTFHGWADWVHGDVVIYER